MVVVYYAMVVPMCRYFTAKIDQSKQLSAKKAQCRSLSCLLLKNSSVVLTESGSLLKRIKE
jgi:hypothetical protein